MRRRVLFVGGAPGPAMPIDVPLDAGDATPLSIATDGTNIVAANQDRVQFLAPDGRLLATQVLAGTVAEGALASGAGDVVAAYRDATLQHAFSRVRIDGIGAPSPAPFGDSDDRVRIGNADRFIIVTRISPTSGRTLAWLFEPDLMTYVGSSIDLSGSMGTPSRATFAATSGGAIAVVASFRGGITGNVLSCGF